MTNVTKLPGETNKAFKARLAEMARVALLATPHAPPVVGSAIEPAPVEAPPAPPVEAASTAPTTQEAPPVASEPAPVPPTAPAPITQDTQGAAFTGERKNPAHVAWLLNPIGAEPDKLHPEYRKWLRAGEKRRAAGKGIGAEHAEYVSNRAAQSRKLADDVAHWGLRMPDGSTLAERLAFAATVLDSVASVFGALPSDFKAPTRPEGSGRKGVACVAGCTFSLKATVAGDYSDDCAASDVLTCVEVKGSRVKARKGTNGPAFWVAAEHVSPASVKVPDVAPPAVQAAPPVEAPPAVDTAPAS